MATEHFCLRWNNHQSTLVSVFDNLLESGTLVDCTLAADGRFLKAHKVVLSACSPYLGMLLSQHYDKHPIIILKDVKFDELKAMLDYMYRGEVNISQEQLSTFLKAAETLQIKGLTDTGGDEGNGLQPNRPPSSSSTTSIPNDDPQSPGPPGEGGSSPSPRKRKRNKHNDDPPDSEGQTKISASEASDRLARDGVSVSGSMSDIGSPNNMKSASFGNVKREPTDTDGDGQMSVDESSDSAMLSRPGPSNGSGTNNKGTPWILSADSTGEEMQLTPGQGTSPEIQNSVKLKEANIKQEASAYEKDTEVNQEPSGFKGVKFNSQHTAKHCQEIENSTRDSDNNFSIYQNNVEEIIIPDMLDSQNNPVTLLRQSDSYITVEKNRLFTSTENNNSKYEDLQKTPAEKKDSQSDLMLLEESSNINYSISYDNCFINKVITKDSDIIDKLSQKTNCEEKNYSITTKDLIQVQQPVNTNSLCVLHHNQPLRSIPRTLIQCVTSSSSSHIDFPNKSIQVKSKNLNRSHVFNETHLKIKQKSQGFQVRKFRKLLPMPVQKESVKKVVSIPSEEYSHNNTKANTLLESKTPHIQLQQNNLNVSSQQEALEPNQQTTPNIHLNQKQNLLDTHNLQITPLSNRVTSTNSQQIQQGNSLSTSSNQSIQQHNLRNTEKRQIMQQISKSNTSKSPHIQKQNQLIASNSQLQQQNELAQNVQHQKQLNSTNLQLIHQQIQQNNVIPSQVISFATPIRSSNLSCSQQLHNNISLPIQPQFTISPSQISSGQLPHTSTSVPLQQFSMSTSQIQGANIQSLTGIMQHSQYSPSSEPVSQTNSQNVVVNQTSQPFTMTQPLLVPTRVLAAAENSTQFLQPQVPHSSAEKIYVKTSNGIIRCLTGPKTVRSKLCKILPK